MADTRTLGQVAYEGSWPDGMPADAVRWVSLPPRVQQEWEATARAVLERVGHAMHAHVAEHHDAPLDGQHVVVQEAPVRPDAALRYAAVYAAVIGRLAHGSLPPALMKEIVAEAHRVAALAEECQS